MPTDELLSYIDAEIARLQKVKSLLSGTTITKATRGPNKAHVVQTPIKIKKRTISAEGRLRIAAAQKARWARAKKAKKAA